MKVIYKMKNNSIQEFQHFLESILIEVMSHKMIRHQFVPSVNLIQMKLMKVIDNNKNILIQEFQHFVESKLIQVMKMQTIQFVSRPNLIQMKLMKVIDKMKNNSIQEFQTGGPVASPVGKLHYLILIFKLISN
jgi:hypothetical protein